MGNWSQKYQRLMKEVKESSFPVLKNKPVFVSESRLFSFDFAMAIIYFYFFAYVFVHPKCREYNEKQIKSIFAHELSHFEIVTKMSIWEKLVFASKFCLFKETRSWFERQTDINAIMKGYGEGLFEVAKKREKYRTKNELNEIYGSGCLSPQEIKRYTKKYG